MRARDWTLILAGFPGLSVALIVLIALIARSQGYVFPTGLGDDWFFVMVVSPAMAVILLVLRRPRVGIGIVALVVSVVISVPVVYWALLVVWSRLLCEPGAHEWCGR